MSPIDRADVIKILIDKFNKHPSVIGCGRELKTTSWYDNRSDIALLQELSWYHKFDPADTCRQTKSH
jgi:hypothetical protein